MREQRTERVAKLLEKEISSLLLFQSKDPRLRRFTITRVWVSADLRLARVFIDFPGTEVERAEKFEALTHATKFVKAELARKVRIRFFPEIVFVKDDLLPKAFRVVQLINQVESERKKGEKDQPETEGSH